MTTLHDRSITKPSMIVAWSIGLTPILLVLTTWNEPLSTAQLFSRFFFLPVVAVEIAAIVFSLRNGGKLALPPAFVSISLTALVAIAWYGAVRSGSPDSIGQTIFWMIHLAFGVAIANIAAMDRDFYRELTTALPLGFIGFAILFFLFAVTRYEPNRNWITDIPAYANVRWMAFYAEAVFGLCAFAWLRGRRLYASIAVLALAIALWTGSRGAIVSIIVGYTLVTILFPIARGGLWRFCAIIGLAVLLAIALTAILPLGNQGPQRLLYDGGNSGRIEIWSQTLPLITQRPWLGWGDAQLPSLLDHVAHIHPHNVILQLLLAWGLTGTILTGVLAVWLARKAHPNVQEATLPLVTAIAMIIIASMFDGSLFVNQSVAIFALLVGALVGAPRAPDFTASAKKSAAPDSRFPIIPLDTSAAGSRSNRSPHLFPRMSQSCPDQGQARAPGRPRFRHAATPSPCKI